MQMKAEGLAKGSVAKMELLFVDLNPKKNRCKNCNGF
jgi:hypothetical protein